MKFEFSTFIHIYICMLYLLFNHLAPGFDAVTIPRCALGEFYFILKTDFQNSKALFYFSAVLATTHFVNI